MVIRVFCLEIVNNAVQAGLVDQEGLKSIKEQLMVYLQTFYGSASQEDTPDSGSIVNKFAQTITFLFSAFYGAGWETCLDDLLALTTKQGGARDNYPGVVFYLTVLNSIHDEIGDQTLSRSRVEQDRANSLKDLIRERDVAKIARSWQEILSQWRTSNDVVAELCLKAVGKWVSWIDISLIVNQQMLELFFQQLERAQKANPPEGEEQAREAAIDVFTEIVAKKMPAADKVDMINFLNLETVVSQLVTCPPLSDSRASNYDVDLAETVAKLVNTAVVEIVKVLWNEDQTSPTWVKAEQLLASFLPHLLRFFSDIFDEVCSTVLNAMTDVLGFLRRVGQGEERAAQRAAMLLPILKAIFAKMRYDDTADWNQEDEQTDEAEFQDLRKKLAALQSTIALADEQLYIEAISTLVHDTFQRLRTEGTRLDWRDLDLALHEVYLLGDLAGRGGGLFQKNKPNSPAAEKLVRMMLEMVQSSTLPCSPLCLVLTDILQTPVLLDIQPSSSSTWRFV
jgi:exportin-T